MVTLDRRISTVTNIEAMRSCPKYDRVMRYVEGEMGRRAFVSVEGPPLYLWPDVSRPAQGWDSSAFTSGYGLTEDIVSRISRTGQQFKLQIHLLVDDVQNRPEGITKEGFAKAFIALGNSASFLKRFLMAAQEGYNTRRVMQSSLSVQALECSKADAIFQAGKFQGLTREGIINQSQIGANLHIMLLPAEFYREQQAKMLDHLEFVVERLHSDLGITPKNARNLINGDFVYIWLSRLGEIADVNQPVFENNKFTFRGFKL